MTEFQQSNNEDEPWYLCRLCRSKVSWSDIVDHVVSVYHRMSFIVSNYSVQGSHRLERYLNLEGFLEKSLKIKFALKSTGKITQKP